VGLLIPVTSLNHLRQQRFDVRLFVVPLEKDVALLKIGLAHAFAPDGDVLVRRRRHDERIENYRGIRLVQAGFDVFGLPHEK
jgi:hypothetical protein